MLDVYVMCTCKCICIFVLVFTCICEQCIMNTCIKPMTICVACIHVRMTFYNFLLLLDVLCGVTFSLQRRLETSVDNKFYYLWASVLVSGMFCKCYFLLNKQNDDVPK